MAGDEEHRAWRAPSVAETLRAPASPFALDADRRAALSLVLMNGFALGDLARLLDVFTSANELAQRRSFGWEIVAISGRSVASSAGIPVAAAGDVTELRPLSTVIVLSDADASAEDCAGLAAWLSAHPASIQRLGGIGGGCSVLGRISAMPKERARGAAQRKELFWRKDDFFGCRGGCATSDFALANVEALLGSAVAQQVLMRLARQRVRKKIEPAADQQQSIETQVAPPIKRAVALMRSTVSRPMPLPAIAAEAGIHLRHLERLFHRHLGVSPRGYYQRLRLARARDLVQGTMMGLARVAEAVGFDSLSHFSKCYMDAHGVRPSEDRQRHFTTPGDEPPGGFAGDPSLSNEAPSKRPPGARRRAA
ncbi:MAG TPA: helix-turn-helix domain-containing protein [Dongiaceae bacterium]|nr:helix-turn-helix domain-containing protein [Dongiaceae bacterium]